MFLLIKVSNEDNHLLYFDFCKAKRKIQKDLCGSRITSHGVVKQTPSDTILNETTRW